jgi:hypothetical protein
LEGVVIWLAREDGKCDERVLLGWKWVWVCVVYRHCTVGSSQRYLMSTWTLSFSSLLRASER